MSTATTEKAATEVEEHPGYAPGHVWPVYAEWCALVEREGTEEWIAELAELLRSKGLRVVVVPGGVG